MAVAAILKITLSQKHSDFDEIWNSDADWHSEPYEP